MATQYQIIAPEPFDCSKSEEWSRWSKRFERFRSASGLADKSGENQVNTLVYHMGDAAEDILESFGLTEDELKVYDTVKGKFDTYFTKKKNTIYERAKFNSRTQEDGEPVEMFITALHKLAAKCEFRDLHDELIRDRIVVGIRNRALSEKMQLDERLTLESATKLARENEAVKLQQTELRDQHKTTVKKEVDAIKQGTGKQSGSVQSRKHMKGPHSYSQRKGTHSQGQSQVKNHDVCTRCGNSHSSGDSCPARTARCHNCGKTGHYQRMCRNKVNINNVQISPQKELFLGTVTQHNSEPWSITLLLNGQPLRFKIDTRADVTVIPDTAYCEERDGPLRPAQVPLFGPSEYKLEVQGALSATISKDTRSTTETIYVVKNLKTPLLGRSAIQTLHLITQVGEVVRSKEGIKSLYPTLFGELGRIKGRYHIELKDTAKPHVVSTPRRVPIPLLPKVKQELERMEQLGVIEKVDGPTDWCSGMVVVPKPGKGVRICVDLTKLNKFVKRERHLLPSVEHVLAQIGNARVFSKLDANSGFWQVNLSSESSKLTTFITPYGRYMFKRLPFGISSAPEFFQKRMAQILEGCEGVVGLIDDILVYGETEEEHHQRLMKVLDKLKSEGMTLNEDKCVFYSDTIQFLGQIVNQEGVSADTGKLRAIKNVPRPTNISELRRFLGMINQMSKFSPNLADRSKPLRTLLSKRNEWVWGPDQELAFEGLKEQLCSSTTLAMFDPEKETKVSADASSFGLGAVLRQKQQDGSWRPVAYISRSMTETEQRYAQIEKEALALTWACERLNQYLMGSKFTLETDHKPLIPLLSSKNLEDLPLRVQRFRLRMMRYQYDIIHVPGKDLLTADFLSREPLKETGSQDLRQEVEAYVNHIWTHLPASNTRLDQIKTLQDKDPVLARWKEQVRGGEKRNKPNCYSELSLEKGLLMKGDRIVIPHDLREDILETLHTGHQGLVKCKERARISVWWPGITQDIESYVKKCRVCCQFQQPKFEPMYVTEFPQYPWEKVGTDLFTWKQKNYLLVVDYYSRYIEIAKLTSMTSEEVITHLKSIFARHGIPQYVISDNGTQYASQLFSNFAKQYGFCHVTSSPRYPQSNGESERAVQTIKSLLNKSDDPYLALLSYRATPLRLGYSPAELLMGRNLKTTVPVTTNKLKPCKVDRESIRTRDQKLKEAQKQSYNRRHRVKEQTPLATGDMVWITDLERQGTVICEDAPRSYRIQTRYGIVRRNRRSLNILPDGELEPDEPDYSYEQEQETNSHEVQDNPQENSEGSSELVRRSSRIRHPPDRYGVWLNNLNQTGGRCGINCI